LVEILDKGQTKWSPAVLVALELGNSGIRTVGTIEANDAAAPGASTGLVLNLGLLYLTDGGEEFDQVLIASRPGKLLAVNITSPNGECVWNVRFEHR
jgi:hypothetical protein